MQHKNNYTVPPYMTGEQFEALAALMRLRVKSSASSRALRRILVEGFTLDEAASLERMKADHIKAMLKSSQACLERVKALAAIAA